MPILRTLLELRTDARRYADMESSEFVPDAEVDRYLNLGIAGLWHEWLQADVDRLLRTTEISTTSGTREYALPDDFAAIRLVEVLQGPGGDVLGPLESFNLGDGTTSGASHAQVYDYIGVRYTVIGQGQSGDETRLLFDPDPQSRAYRVRYIPGPPVLVNDGNTLDGVAGWEEWAVLWAAEQMMAKEESDPSALIRRRAELTERMRILSGSRNAGMAPSVARVRHRRRGGRRARSG